MKSKPNSFRKFGRSFLIIALILTFQTPFVARVHADDTPGTTPGTVTMDPTLDAVVSDAATVPNFSTCASLVSKGAGDLAHYTSGMHQIAGDGLKSGADDVYSLSDGNAVQCFCPTTGLGIQTNWWKTTNASTDGWISIDNGLSWNLSDSAYLALNSDFNCNPPVLPNCETLTAAGIGDLAHYTSGLHQIAGDGLQEGSDDVYAFTDGNAMQCFCPPSGLGIQTLWWKTDMTLAGWIAIDNGTSWNLSNSAYLAMNTNFDCKPADEGGGEQPGANITVTKVVTNDDGGTAVVGDFLLKVGQAVVTSGVLATNFPAGSYDVTESGGPQNYTATFSGDCDSTGHITMDIGKTYTCTITNNDNPQPTSGANITVTKVVVNDNGGTNVASDYTLKVGQAVVTSGILATNFTPGTYTVTESGPTSGYNASFSGDCDANGQITLVASTNLTCTITNNDIAKTTDLGGGENNPPPPPPLVSAVSSGGGGGGSGPVTSVTVTKVVINDNSGTAVVGDFVLKVGSVTVTSGNPTTFPVGGPFTVSESGPTAGYVATFSGDCNSSGIIPSLVESQSYSCTITNNDIGVASTTVENPPLDLGGGEVAGATTMAPVGGVAAGGGGFDLVDLFVLIASLIGVAVLTKLNRTVTI